MPDLKASLSRKLGPLPAWGWGVAIGGTFLAVRLLRGGNGDETKRQLIPTGAEQTDTTSGFLSGLSTQLFDIQTRIGELEQAPSVVTPAPDVHDEPRFTILPIPPALKRTLPIPKPIQRVVKKVTTVAKTKPASVAPIVYDMFRGADLVSAKPPAPRPVSKPAPKPVSVVSRVSTALRKPIGKGFTAKAATGTANVVKKALPKPKPKPQPIRRPTSFAAPKPTRSPVSLASQVRRGFRPQ